MFVFNRSAIAVLAPLALLVAVVLCSSLEPGMTAAPAGAAQSRSGAEAQVAHVAPLRDADG